MYFSQFSANVFTLFLPSVSAYLCLYFFDVTVGQHQHPQGPQSNKVSGFYDAQIVSSKLQQPRTMREAPGYMFKFAIAAVHQVSMLIANALVRAHM